MPTRSAFIGLQTRTRVCVAPNSQTCPKIDGRIMLEDKRDCYVRCIGKV